MSDGLLQFKSHIDGKNADVVVFEDRIEWSRDGRVSLTRMAAGAATMGASLLKTGVRTGGGSEMIPIRSISSVTTKKDGLVNWKVVVITSGNTIEFRVDKSTAEHARTLLTQLITGSFAGTTTSPPPPPVATAAPAVATAPAPPPPPVPAGAAHGNVADELLKLKQLLDAGVLSDAEFAAQKARVLGS